ncbi:MAG TPA: hypothetical protein VJL80_14590 [Aeromicrobium sp.]|nr:hypothetical protein [Aeromicrobium sp.]HKY59262.1 hypothetical protein [Aeromicrobium sp.]
MSTYVDGTTMRALVWRWDGETVVSGGRRWTYDLFYGPRRDAADNAAVCGIWYATREEAWDAACAELRKRGES